MTSRLNTWPLFCVLALAASLVNLLGLHGVDFQSGRGMSPIILRSVRCALPLFLVAFTASSLARLWPSVVTRWLLANRRYIGLAFAFGMAWHISFVAYRLCTFGNPLNPKATALDALGFVFLLLLTLTSFRPFARKLSSANWRRLHTTGVYVIWLVPTLIYLHRIRKESDVFDRMMFAVLLAAYLLRAAAWAKKRFGGGSGSVATLATARQS